jgi:FlaA1/EpsC-like NDP-sugar epimerase
MTEKSEYTGILERDLFVYQPDHRFENTTIAITGAAGSIGSRLVKTLLEKSEARLILIDQNEYTLNRLLVQYSRYQSRIHALLADIQDTALIKNSFQEYRPGIVVHAAAYKQVPMLERYPAAAVLNNIRNTESVYGAALESGVKKFIFISTDKVFSAGNVLGKSKKIAERLIGRDENCMQSLILRFGNVLYSSGSVSELFRSQILENKKLTVTDPEATRYFITPEEGSDFILFAMDRELPDAIYYLYQEKQIRMLDLARRIYSQLRGTEPTGDWWERIPPRPGDAASEFDLSQLKDDPIDSQSMIRKTCLPDPCIDSSEFQDMLPQLYRMAEISRHGEEMKEKLGRLCSFTL